MKTINELHVRCGVEECNMEITLDDERVIADNENRMDILNGLIRERNNRELSKCATVRRCPAPDCTFQGATGCSMPNERKHTCQHCGALICF